MNLAEIARRVRNQFGDSAGIIVTDQALYDWVNDACRDIAMANGLLQIRGTLTTSVGVGDYAVPSNLLTLISAYFNGEKLKGMSQQQADEYGQTNPNNASGVPQMFSQYGDNITLYPAPSSADDLVLFYTRIPAEVDSMDDVPEIALQYHNRIVEYCLAKAAELDNDSSAGNRMAQFKQNVDDMRDNVEWLERDYYPHMGVALPDASGYSYSDDF